MAYRRKPGQAHERVTVTTTETRLYNSPMSGYSATYSPEDNKLRLYVGRVPRDEYEKLRAEGWVSTPKQNCNFVAPWTPERRDTALEYAGIIEDEDMGPDERAADRAERFGGYRNKRTDEATGRADAYDAGPSAHGYQSQARAERAALKHDRIAGRACDAWGKAEYWQRRTAGVISHALYVSSPGVRMGRIKTLEAELRKLQASIAESQKRFDTWQKIANEPDAEKQLKFAKHFAGYSHSEYPHPDSGVKRSLWRLLEPYEGENERPLSGAEAAALWLSDHTRPEENDWTRHYALRLAYENQMLEAQGGRLAHVEIEAGGKIGGKLIIKVNKSTVTGRVTSVDLLGPKVQGWCYKVTNIPGTEYAAYSFDTERMPPDAYKPPTPETLAELAAFKASKKASAPDKAPCPLINPTDADAERLQAIWNERQIECLKLQDKRSPYGGDSYVKAYKPSEVFRMTQAQYSANSQGEYSRCSTRPVYASGVMGERYYRAAEKQREQYGPPPCQVRRTSGGNYSADRVIVLTDKPQKPLPAAVWQKPVLAALVAASEVIAV